MASPSTPPPTPCICPHQHPSILLARLPHFTRSAHTFPLLPYLFSNAERNSPARPLLSQDEKVNKYPPLNSALFKLPFHKRPLSSSNPLFTEDPSPPFRTWDLTYCPVSLSPSDVAERNPAPPFSLGVESPSSRGPIVGQWTPPPQPKR